MSRLGVHVMGNGLDNLSLNAHHNLYWGGSGILSLLRVVGGMLERGALSLGLEDWFLRSDVSRS